MKIKIALFVLGLCLLAMFGLLIFFATFLFANFAVTTADKDLGYIVGMTGALVGIGIFYFSILRAFKIVSGKQSVPKEQYDELRRLYNRAMTAYSRKGTTLLQEDQ